MPSSTEIRQQFIDFFCKKHGHTFVPSSPVVPLDDPTLLFANAGMNQFKPYFLGTQKPPYPRVANTQKCIRAGGKHNDLDDVGKDTYHHTFFEMLGNWSFGDYFKKEAIAWAWELLTQVWKLDTSRLHVTVFEGDPANGIPRDEEAAGFWKAVGVPEGHIHLGNKKDNFWEMGNTGPCGPCTEVHYDRTPDKSGGRLVNAGTPEVIEIWNLVFIQFNRNEDQSLTPLPARHVDTGMGFERICAVLQGKTSNYDTDVFTPILDAIREVTNAQPYTGKLDDLKDTAYRVIGDHIRTLTFALTDGAIPSNTDRGYVLRSILRRAIRYGWEHLGVKEPFLAKLIPAVVAVMGNAFPEIIASAQHVSKLITDEEIGFLRTLERGMTLLRGELKNAREVWGEARQYLPGTGHDNIVSAGVKAYYHKYPPSKYNSPVISDAVAFELHDTYGLYIDILEQLAVEAGVLVDRKGFERLMQAARERNRAARKSVVVEAIKGDLPKTDDSYKFDSKAITARVIGWVINNVVVRDGKIGNGERASILFDRTNFYSEQGGQVGDTGTATATGITFEVEDTQRLGDAVLHTGTLQEGAVTAGTELLLRVDTARTDTMRNHTATHLMNLALRDVLGPHVEQKGSLVDADKTRFDFSHDKPLTPDEIRAVEERVNRAVAHDLPVAAVTMPLAEAKKLPGVRAVFGEKYPDPVRVVMVGAERPEEATAELSVEFCGGTHVPRTGPIGYFKIVEQGGVAKGVRRVTAVTGRAANETLAKVTAVVDDLTAKFQCKPEELPARVEALQDEVKKLKAQLAKGVAADLSGVVDKLLADAPEVNGTKLVVGQLPAAPVEQVRTQIDRVRQKVKSALIVFGSADDEGKVPLVVALTDDLVQKKLKAGDIIRPVAEIVGGKGGGKPDLAQAGGKDPTKLGEALKKAGELGRELLGK